MATRPLLPTTSSAGRDRNVNNIQNYGAIDEEDVETEVHRQLKIVSIANNC